MMMSFKILLLFALVVLGQIQIGCCRRRKSDQVVNLINGFMDDQLSEFFSPNNREKKEEESIVAVKACLFPIVRMIADDPMESAKKLTGYLRTAEDFASHPEATLLSSATRFGVDAFMRAADLDPQGRKVNGIERAMNCVKSLTGMERKAEMVVGKVITDELENIS